MRIRLITIANKPPGWVDAGFKEYVKRLPPTCSLELIEIPAEKRTSNINIEQIKAKESQKILAAIKPRHRVIALDVKGKAWSTEDLATNITGWMQDGSNIDLIIGGADGLDDNCLNKAETSWSLSKLTFPHMLVRIIIAEQVYRACSIIQNHPYHR